MSELAITAAIVVIVGSISYIGLIVPNIVSIFKGDNIRGSLIDTALVGAIFVLISDILARIIIYPYELPVNLVAGVIGSLIFIGLIILRLKGNKLFVKKRKGVTKNES